jgi:hypothetical protein
VAVLCDASNPPSLSRPELHQCIWILEWHQAALQVERRFELHSEVFRSYRVPGYEAPIWLRDTVADHSFFWQCIVVRQYAVEAFPQARRLLAEYEGILRRGDVPVILDAGSNIVAGDV